MTPRRAKRHAMRTPRWLPESIMVEHADTFGFGSRASLFTPGWVDVAAYPELLPYTVAREPRNAPLPATPDRRDEG